VERILVINSTLISVKVALFSSPCGQRIPRSCLTNPAYISSKREAECLVQSNLQWFVAGRRLSTGIVDFSLKRI